MDKYLKIVLIIVAVLMMVSLGKSFFSGGDDNLSKAIDNINKSQQKIDSSLMQINYTRNRIDSIRNDMQVFKQYIRDIQGRVEILDLENRKGIADYKKYRDSLKNRLNDLYHTIDTTADNLPNFVVTN
jgi:chromosome segregation ATPase